MFGNMSLKKQVTQGCAIIDDVIILDKHPY